MKHLQLYSTKAFCLLAGLLFVSSVFAATMDVTGIVPTIWLDFETRPDSAGLATVNKGSASVSFKDEGTKSYKGGANGGYALDTSEFTPYTEAGTFSTAGQPFTISLVMNLGTTANGVTLSVRNETGQKDLVIRRGATAGSLVVGCDTWMVAAKFNLETSFENDSAWHLVSIVVEKTGVSLYVDGDFVSSMTDYTLWSATGYVSRFQFGSHLSGPQGDEVKGGGLIDELRIHNAVLSSAQMKAIAAEYGLATVAGVLTVLGSPENWETVVPAYGVTNGLSQGDVIACSAVGSETETRKCIPVGHALYSVASDGTKTLIEENAAASFTYTHGADRALLVWSWAHSNFVSVATSEGGTVSAGGWVGYGDSFTVTATPYSGYKFNRWTGDTAGIDVTSASIVLASVTEPRALSAIFLGESIDGTVQWVSPAGDDGNDGYDESSPKKTIAAAVRTLNPVAANKTCTVHVAPGLYPISSPIVVTNAIHILGADPNPSRTVVSNTFTVNWDNQNKRVFRINNADALVANLTMQKGQYYYGAHGGNFYIGSAGGMVSNCVVEAGKTSGNAQAAGACLEGGFVSHSIFRKNTSSSGTAHWDGKWKGVLYMKGSSRVENCLFVDNSHTVPVVLIGLAGNSSMRNCTIVDTALTSTNQYCNVFAAINIESQNALLKNVVVAGVTNAIDGGTCSIIGYTSRFQNCAYDGDTTGLPEGTIGGTTESFFKGYAKGDYHPNPRNPAPLYNKGESYEGMAATDLEGRKRLIGNKIDIGCYESPAAELLIRLR